MSGFQQVSPYEIGDTVIINTAGLTGLRHHPPSGKNSLKIAPQMYQDSGKIAKIVWRGAYAAGYLYRLSVHSSYYYTNELLLPASNLTNLKASAVLNRTM